MPDTPRRKRRTEPRAVDALPMDRPMTEMDVSGPRDREAVQEGAGVVPGFTTTGPSGSVGGRSMFGLASRDAPEIEAPPSHGERPPAGFVEHHERRRTHGPHRVEAKEGTTSEPRD